MGRQAPLVTLRPLVLRDADVMTRWAADPEFCREAGWSEDLTYLRAQRFHRSLVQSPPAELKRLGAVHDGHLVGYVDLHGTDDSRRELGFVIGERHMWERGLGFSAAVAGLQEGFARLGLEEIWAEAADANQRSIRILQRLGMRETMTDEHAAFRDEPSHLRRFEITRQRWSQN